MKEEREVKTSDYYRMETIKYLQMAQEAVYEGKLVDAYHLMLLANKSNSMAIYLHSPATMN